MSANQPPEGNHSGDGSNPVEKRDDQQPTAGGGDQPSFTQQGQQGDNAGEFPQSGPQGTAGYGVGPDGQQFQPGTPGQQAYGSGSVPPPGAQGQPGYGVGPDGQPLPRGGFGYQPPPPPKKQGVAKRLIGAIITLVVVIGVGLAVRGFFSGPSMAVGDCVQKVSDDEVKKVTCGTAEADFQILGIKEKQARAASRLPTVCNEWPEATSVYWTGRSNSSGTIYCLKQA